MFKNYLKVAFRNLLKNKTYSFITIIGLAIGLSFCLLSFSYVYDEWTYDQFHDDHDRIYRIYYEGSIKRYQMQLKESNVHTALGPALKEDFPEVEDFVRLTSTRSSDWEDYHPYFKIGDNTFRDTFLLTDPSFFKMFSFQLQHGDENHVLDDINSIVISQKAALKYFNGLDPIGKTISMQAIAALGWRDFKISGILQNIPENSSIKADFILPYGNLSFFYYNEPDWRSMMCNTYISLAKNTNIDGFQEKLQSLVQTHMSTLITPEDQLAIKLQPLKDVHSNTSIDKTLQFRHSVTPPNPPLYSYVLASLCLIILIIASINYVNLSLGRLSTRIKEIRIRKVVGAGRYEIMRQFLLESIIFTLLAVGSGFLFLELVLPYFNGFTGKSLSFNLLSFSSMFFVIGLIVIVGILAGFYPATLLSTYHPANTLKSMMKIGGKNNLRHTLILVQFCFTIILIVISIIMARQVNYIQSSKTIGFNKESIVVINTEEMPEIHKDGSNNYNKKLLTEKLKLHANILNVGTTRYYHTTWQYPSQVIHPEKGEFNIRKICIDYDFINTFQLQLVQGRNFSEDLDNKNTGSMIVSESFAEQMNWQNPIGQIITFDMNNRRELWESKGVATVIGVVKDFHFLSLKDETFPGILLLNPSIGFEAKQVFAKISTQDIPETLSYIREVWEEVNPELTFRYSFFDQDIENYYLNEFHWLKLISFTSFFAIFIACIGLFGIMSLVVNNRTKEIGIRKVCGASIPSLWTLLSKDYVKLVLIANLIAAPLAWYAMNRWLQNFAYQINMRWWIFVFAGGLALVIALLTVSYQAFRAATANPVESLRYE